MLDRRKETALSAALVMRAHRRRRQRAGRSCAELVVRWPGERSDWRYIVREALGLLSALPLTLRGERGRRRSRPRRSSPDCAADAGSRSLPRTRRLTTSIARRRMPTTPRRRSSTPTSAGRRRRRRCSCRLSWTGARGRAWLAPVGCDRGPSCSLVVLAASSSRPIACSSAGPSGRRALPLSVHIPEGSSVEHIGDILDRAGVVGNGRRWALNVRLHGDGSGLRAGRYTTLRTNERYSVILSTLRAGPTAVPTVKSDHPRGLRARATSRSTTRPSAGISPKAYRAAVRRARPPAGYRATGNERLVMEGFLFPATYTLTKPVSWRRNWAQTAAHRLPSERSPARSISASRRRRTSRATTCSSSPR